MYKAVMNSTHDIFLSYMFPCDCDGPLRIYFPCMQACILAVGRGVKKVVWDDECGKLSAPC
jgi:hypothetical protein